MTVLVNAIRQRIDIEVIDLNDIVRGLHQLGLWAYQATVFLLKMSLKFGFKLMGQMALTIIIAAWFILWATGAILSNIH